MIAERNLKMERPTAKKLDDDGQFKFNGVKATQERRSKSALHT